MINCYLLTVNCYLICYLISWQPNAGIWHKHHESAAYMLLEGIPWATVTRTSAAPAVYAAPLCCRTFHISRSHGVPDLAFVRRKSCHGSPTQVCLPISTPPTDRAYYRPWSMPQCLHRHKHSCEAYRYRLANSDDREP